MAAPATNGSPSQYRLFAGVVAGAAALILLLTQLVGGGDGEPTAASSDAANEVRLEPVSYTPADAFTSTIAEEGPAPDPAAARFPVEPASAGAIRSAPADAVGLYGGSLNTASCDREQLVTFLESDPVKAQAWVDALNSDPTLQWSGGNRVEVSQIRDYIFELTPVILRTDTWVTNHGFSDGRPIPLQSLLQAGTAVLVDGYGVPRVRCYCGNPLLPPRSDVRPTYTGSSWDDFDPDQIIVVQPSITIIQTFVLTDVQTGQTIIRDPGTEGEADIEAPAVDPSPLPTEAIGTTPTVAAPDVAVLEGRYSVGQYSRDPSCGEAVENNVTALAVLDASIGSGETVGFRVTFRDGTSHRFDGHITPDLVGIVDLRENGSKFQLELQFTVNGTSVEAEGTIHISVPDFFSCTDQATFVK